MNRILFSTITGSTCYGTNIPESDVDIRGVFLAPPEQYLGYHPVVGGDKCQSLGELIQKIEKFSHLGTFHIARKSYPNIEDTKDIELLEFKKFVQLAANNNPNVLELLFIPRSFFLYSSKEWEKVLDTRYAFLSKRCKHTFTGYAHSQLSRIETHRGWLLNPPKAPPTRDKFGLPEMPLLGKDARGAAESLLLKEQGLAEFKSSEPLPPGTLDRIGEVIDNIILKLGSNKGELRKAAASALGMDSNLLEYLDKEQAFKSAVRHWNQYQDWITNRNPIRAALEAKCGYDSKHGGYLIRLMRMGLEILNKHDLFVDRSQIDAQELKEIRQGNWSYEKLMDECNRLNLLIEEAYIVSKLRAKPDTKHIDLMCGNIMKGYING